jgi:hypothetical protein
MSRALMVTAAAAVVIILGVAIAFTRSNNPEIPNASISPQMGELGDSVVVFLIPDVGEPATMTAIDPTSGSVVWTHPTGVDPAAAVALDRQSIALASGLDQSSNLTIVDITTGGETSHVGFQSRWRNTLPAYFPALVRSVDDRWVFGLEFAPAGPEQDVYTVAIFDTQSQDFEAERLALPNCVGAILLPGLRRLDAVCPDAGTVISFPEVSPGAYGPPSSVRLTRGSIAGAVKRPNSDSIVVLTEAGKLIGYGPAGIEPAVALAAGSKEPQFASFLISKDARRVYVGWRSGSDRFSTIESFDAASGSLVASVDLPTGAWAMSLSRDGSQLFVTMHQAAELSVIDALSLEVVATHKLSAEPALILSP